MLPSYKRSQVLFNEEKTARVFGVTKGTLRRWRREGKGPPWHKLGDEPGAAIRYLGGDLAQWLASRRKGGNRPA